MASFAALLPLESCCLAVHGETGGDGRFLAVLLGDALPDIGANLLSAEYEGSCAVDGDCEALAGDMKLSMALGSGGDIKLEIGGSRVIFALVMMLSGCVWVIMRKLKTVL